MMKKFLNRLFIAAILSTSSFVPILLFGQSNSSDISTLSVAIFPRYDLPILGSKDHFDNGFSGQVSLSYKPPVAFPLYAGFDLGYTYLPLKLEWANPLHTAIVGGGLGVNYRFLGRFEGDLYIKGGYYETMINDLSGNLIYGGNPYLDAGAGLSFYISSRIKVGIGASYRQFFGLPSDLYKGIGLYMGASYRFPLSGSIDINSSKDGFGPSKIRIDKLKMSRIFPVFYKYYDNHPVGKFTINNGEKGDISDISVSFYIKKYMDNPKTYKVHKKLKKGDSTELDIFALFNDQVLNITEGAKVSSELTVTYNYKNSLRKKSVVNTVSLQNRNASIWDDNRRAAAFVTARDPVVLKVSKNLAGVIRDEPNKVFGKNFMSINVIHNALREYGITYVVDPKTPYKEFHDKKQAVDFLQFPRQTLEYKAGDCDDLSILYSAMLEALSIDTAFITVPGHIFIGVDLGVTEKEAKDIFYSTNNLIIRNGKVWLPFEVTMIQDQFPDAWEKGAMEWEKYSSSGDAGFYPVSDAWKTFEPVGLPGNIPDITVVSTGEVKKRFAKSMQFIIKQEVDGKAQELKKRIEQSGSYRLVNKLGILYARYGLYKDAEREFEKMIKKSNYKNVGLINLGNIRFKKGDYNGALEYYKKAKKNLPDNSKLLVNIARANYELGNYKNAESYYKEAKIISPEIAEKYYYLGKKDNTTGRASDANEKGNVLWEE